MPEIHQLSDPLIAATGLDEQDAKTAVYWRLGSLKIKERQTYPPLLFAGPSGSGKTSSMEAIKGMHPESAYAFSCTGVTPASSRDELAKALNMVAFAEEFDLLTDVHSSIKYFQARCDRKTSSHAFKDKTNDNGAYHPKTVELFGATVLHSRNVLSEPAMVSRSITIATRHSDKESFPDFAVPSSTFLALYEAIDWEVKATGVVAKGRLYDTWYPVLQIAAALGDQDWLDWAGEKVRWLQQRLEEAAGYDHKQLILSRIVELIADNDATPTEEIWSRLNVSTDIGEYLRRNGIPDISGWEVADTIKEFGFLTKRRGGRLWLYPTAASLFCACDSVHYEDEWVSELRVAMQLSGHE